MLITMIASAYFPPFFKIILLLPDKMKQIIKPQVLAFCKRRPTSASSQAAIGNLPQSSRWRDITISTRSRRLLCASIATKPSHFLSISESTNIPTLTKSHLSVELTVALSPSVKEASSLSTEELTKTSTRKNTASSTQWVRPSSSMRL